MGSGAFFVEKEGEDYENTGYVSCDREHQRKPKYVCSVRNTNPDLPCAGIFMEKGEAEQMVLETVREACWMRLDDLKQCSMLEKYDGNVLLNLIDRVYIYGDGNLQIVFKNDDYFRKVCKEGG